MGRGKEEMNHKEEDGGKSHGAKYLRRLETFLDVVYGLLFFQMLLYLPRAEDMKWVGQPLGLLQVLIDHSHELLRIVVGLGLTLIYWNLNNRLFGPLGRTDARHSVFSLLQMVFVCFFIYFAISDPFLQGGPSSPALQSVSLSIAGFIAALGWRYARTHNLVAERYRKEERDKMTRNSFIEPVTALLNTPVAWLGPIAWTIGWFTIPFLVTFLVRKRK